MNSKACHTATQDLNFNIERILAESDVKLGVTSITMKPPLASLDIPASYFPLFGNLKSFPTSCAVLYDHLKTIAKPKIEKYKEIPRRIGHPYQSRAPPKHKKLRTSFSKQQIALLEARFDEQKYLASEERSILAAELQMSDSQVKTWFQNRRTKWRRQEAEEKECAEKANVRFLYSHSLYLNSKYSHFQHSPLK